MTQWAVVYRLWRPGVCRADGFGLRYLETTGAGYVEREGALTVCWNVRFEDVPPVRNFPSYQGQRNFSDLYFAACMGRHVGARVVAERDQFIMLDFSPTVSFLVPALLVAVVDRGEDTSARPGFIRSAGRRTGMVVDVRADDRIEPEDAEVFEVTAAACELESSTTHRTAATTRSSAGSNDTRSTRRNREVTAGSGGLSRHRVRG